MPTTAELRRAWSPACQSINRANFEKAYRVLDDIFKKWNYRPRSGVTYGYSCRQITGGSGYSLHSYRDNSTFKFYTGVAVAMAVAVDINSDKNPYGSHLVTDMPRGMVEEICAVRTNSGHQVWGWGGYYKRNKDAMHYELNCFPNQLASGIAPYPAQNHNGEPTHEEGEDEVKLTRYKVSVDPNNSKTAPGDDSIWLTDGVTTHVLSSDANVHGGNIGWYPDAIFVPKGLHDWLVGNTHGQNQG